MKSRDEACRLAPASPHPRTAFPVFALVAFFLLTCAAYFWVCRRLSLVTEWAFLCGFAAALPCSVTGLHWATRSRWRSAWEGMWTGVGYAAFSWSGVLVQIWKG